MLPRLKGEVKALYTANSLPPGEFGWLIALRQSARSCAQADKQGEELKRLLTSMKHQSVAVYEEENRNPFVSAAGQFWCNAYDFSETEPCWELVSPSSDIHTFPCANLFPRASILAIQLCFA